MLKRYALCVTLLATTYACSVQHESKSEDYSYQLSLNGCDTGKHSFSSQGELCDGLRNQKLNNSCAESMRANEYKNRGCPGDFTLINE